VHPLRKLREARAASVAQYAELLAENVVFHSPVFVKAVQGRANVAAIFAASASAREGRYVDEYELDDRATFLRWQGTIDGHELESLEVIVDDARGLIAERTLAFRPYPALKLFRDTGYKAFKDQIPADMWDYPENTRPTE
jgi:hypothetical protein